MKKITEILNEKENFKIYSVEFTLKGKLLTTAANEEMASANIKKIIEEDTQDINFKHFEFKSNKIEETDFLHKDY